MMVTVRDIDPCGMHLFNISDRVLMISGRYHTK